MIKYLIEIWTNYSNLDAMLNIDCEAQSSDRSESAAPTVTADNSKCIEHFIPVRRIMGFELNSSQMYVKKLRTLLRFTLT